MTSSLSIGPCATWAIVLEATAHKPGNVHRGADFEDMTFIDIIAAAVAIGPILERADSLGVGATIHQSVGATRRMTNRNTNLGTLLLLAPLAIAAKRNASDMQSCTAIALQELTAEDSHDTYAAIRLASPGGMGTVHEADVQSNPPDDLIAAMRLAEDRDLVARQYANGYQEVFDVVLPSIAGSVSEGANLFDAIVLTQIKLLAEYPDSLIARKCGPTIAQEASDRAAAVLSAGPVDSDAYYRALNDLDFWLRSDGNRRNPGTIADLIAAALFVGLVNGTIDYQNSRPT